VKLTGFAAAFIAASVALAGCGGDDDDEASDIATEEGSGGTVRTVEELEALATMLVDGYHADNPDSELTVTVESQNDVVQTASAGTGVALLPEELLAGTGAASTVIGRVLAIIVVPEGNPAQVTGVDAFSMDAGVAARACGPDSSLGNFAEMVVRLGGVEPDPARMGTDCGADAVEQVAQGELDAALVFRNGVTLPSGVEVIELPEDQNVIVDVAYTPSAGDDLAAGFAAWLGSDAATQILTDEGYLP
jgi:DNA-binding transcriptional LysR family regulator